jgi:hypothetical protein
MPLNCATESTSVLLSYYWLTETTNLQLAVGPSLNAIVSADALEQIHADVQVLGSFVPWVAVRLRRHACIPHLLFTTESVKAYLLLQHTKTHPLCLSMQAYCIQQALCLSQNIRNVVLTSHLPTLKTLLP